MGSSGADSPAPPGIRERANPGEPAGERRHSSFIEAVTRRPVAVTMFVLSLAVFGIVSFSKLSVDLLPDISYPTLTVRTAWPGAAPEDVEERVSEKIQEALSTLDDLVRSTSISRAGASDVLLEFEWDTPMTFAVHDVREKLDGVFLPDGAERPLILRYDPNLDPILRIGIRGPHGKASGSTEQREDELIQLRWLAENRVKRELEALEGVAAVQVHGGLEEEIRVRVDPFQLAALHVDPGELATRLARENINASGGSLHEGSAEFLVRTVNQFLDVQEIEELPVTRRGEGVIRVRDVARVERTYEKREVISRIGGAESVEVAVFREAGANIVELADRVKERVFGNEAQQRAAEELEAREKDEGRGATIGERNQVDFLAWNMRDDLALDLLSDQSTFIKDAVDDVKQSAWLGALLAVGVIWLFLGRPVTTFVVGISIPITLVVAFAPMFLADITLNIMSLGGLALAVGMLLDNAIVMIESVTRCREEGDHFVRAATRGTSEVFGAMVASTLTSIAVFAPIVFVSGIAGQIFGDQALTVVSTQLISLLVAVLLIPMLTSRRWLAGMASSDAPPPERPPRIGEGLPSWEGRIPGVPRNLSRLLLRIPVLRHGVLLMLVMAGKISVSEYVTSGLVVLGRLLLGLLGILILVLLLLGGLLLVLLRILFWPIDFIFQRSWNAVARSYAPLLRGALRHSWLVLLVSLALLALSFQRVSKLGVELLPEIHQGEFTAHVRLHVGSPLATTDAVLAELDERVRELPGVDSTALTVGIERETLSRDIEGPNTARLTVRLGENGSSAEREERITAWVRELLASHPAVEAVEIRRPTPFALEAPIAVEVKGYDLEALASTAAEVERRLHGVEGLTDIRSTLRPGYPEARITFDREKMLELGLDLSQVTSLVRDQVLGNVSTRFHEGEERIGIRVIGDEVVLDTLEALRALPINPSASSPVPLASVADIELVPGPAEIRRLSNTRAMVVSAASSGIDLGGLSKRIEAALSTMSVPEEVSVGLGGQKREMDEAITNMRFALLLAIFLVYVVMACQFESLLQPLVIMLTLPLAAVGVIFALELLEIPLSVVVFLGLILLAGIVVNNAIVLIDRINQMRASGLTVREAILEAGESRLRPILMTTATAVLGLLPMTGWLAGVPLIGSLGAGAGAEIRLPMAVTVIAGLSSSTLLTLFVIPVVYSLVAHRERRAPVPS